MTTTRWPCLLLVLAACYAPKDGADDFYMDDDVPAGNCMTGTGCATDGSEGGSTAASEATCESTLECDDGQMCVATFDGDIGEFECSSTCIDDMEEERWCLDDDACCMAGSVCSERGYCTPGEGTTADTGDASTSDATGAATSSTGG